MLASPGDAKVTGQLRSVRISGLRIIEEIEIEKKKVKTEV